MEETEKIFKEPEKQKEPTRKEKIKWLLYSTVGWVAYYLAIDGEHYSDYFNPLGYAMVGIPLVSVMVYLNKKNSSEEVSFRSALWGFTVLWGGGMLFSAAVVIAIKLGLITTFWGEN